MADILTTEKPKTITLVDGNEYNLPPLDMTTLANIEESLGFGINGISQRLEDKPMVLMRQLIYAILKENYPAMTIDEVGHLITIKEMAALSDIISKIMALS